MRKYTYTAICCILSLACLNYASGTTEPKKATHATDTAQTEEPLMNLTLNTVNSKLVVRVNNQVIASVDITRDKITEEQKYDFIKFIVDLYYNKLNFVQRNEEMNDESKPCTPQKIHEIPEGSIIHVKGLTKLANVEEMKVTLHITKRVTITFKNNPSTGYFMWLRDSDKHRRWERRSGGEGKSDTTVPVQV